jgi:hypothetical protein
MTSLSCDEHLRRINGFCLAHKAPILSPSQPRLLLPPPPSHILFKWTFTLMLVCIFHRCEQPWRVQRATKFSFVAGERGKKCRYANCAHTTHTTSSRQPQFLEISHPPLKFQHCCSEWANFQQVAHAGRAQKFHSVLPHMPSAHECMHITLKYGVVKTEGHAFVPFVMRQWLCEQWLLEKSLIWKSAYTKDERRDQAHERVSPVDSTNTQTRERDIVHDREKEKSRRKNNSLSY